VKPKLLSFLSQQFGKAVTAEDVVAYVVALAAHPAFTQRFKADLIKPGLRIPITADLATFEDAVRLGRRVIWLHTFGERMADQDDGRPAGPPRLPRAKMPFVPKEGAIPLTASEMPNAIDYDESNRRLLLGQGYVENVAPCVWKYEVSGKQVLLHWFSYRKANRERPIIGDRRAPSSLCDVRPDCWLAEYTTELINVLNVLGLLIEREPQQALLLEQVCAGPMLSTADLAAAGAFDVLPKTKRGAKKRPHPELFDTK